MDVQIPAPNFPTKNIFHEGLPNQMDVQIPAPNFPTKNVFHFFKSADSYTVNGIRLQALSFIFSFPVYLLFLHQKS